MFATGGRGVTTGVMNVVGCVEHSDTRHLIIIMDGYRQAPPILHLLARMTATDPL